MDKHILAAVVGKGAQNGCAPSRLAMSSIFDGRYSFPRFLALVSWSGMRSTPRHDERFPLHVSRPFRLKRLLAYLRNINGLEEFAGSGGVV
jgi:hypothetical protein